MDLERDRRLSDTPGHGSATTESRRRVAGEKEGGEEVAVERLGSGGGLV